MGVPSFSLKEIIAILTQSSLHIEFSTQGFHQLIMSELYHHLECTHPIH